MSQLSPVGLRSGSFLLRSRAVHHVARHRLVICRHASNSTSNPTRNAPKHLNPYTKEPKVGEEYNPEPLSRPLGLSTRPAAGQSFGVDTRSWGQRRDDFLNYDKHLVRRAELTKQVSKPYYRDWKNLRYHKGKTFIAPPKLFRADKALYFPNMRGVTLAEPHDEQDTTIALESKISIVCIFTGTWAEQQTASFTRNEKLKEILQVGHGLIQRADINIEENFLRASLIKLFMGGLKRKIPEEQHGRYFLVRKGVTEEIKHSMGIFNNQVGFLYLVDSHCRIRWAGCAEAEPKEMESLLRGIKRLVQELKQMQDIKDGSEEAKSVEVADSVFNAVTSIVE